MAKINVLERHVAELIAAGEVVDRPASVVKELVENSIDAGAKQITIEIKNGGVTYLRVTDDGCGISGEDVPKAFLRHATSKVRGAEDLSEIATLGFRGEALAAVAATCKVELLTCAEEEETGTRYGIEGGDQVIFEEAGCPKGTTIIVRDIFYNTPARMKFLKKDVTEGNAVASIVDKMALSHPEIAFRFFRDGQLKLQTAGDNDLLGAIFQVYGREVSSNMIPVAYQSGILQVSGYICRPQAARPNRTLQNFFVNHRFVRSKTAMAAMEEAFKGYVMVGKFPYGVLNIQIDWSLVDVNVHPAKLEVKFADERGIFDVVYHGCKNALLTFDRGVDISLPKEHFAKINPFILEKTPQVQPQKISATAYRNLVKGYESDHNNEPVKKIGSQRELCFSSSQTIYQPETKRSYSAADSIYAPPVVKKQPAVNIDISVVDPETIRVSKPVETTVLPEVIKPAMPMSEDALNNEVEKAQVVGELFDTYIVAQQGDEMLLIDKHAAHERLIYEQLKKEHAENVRQLLLQPVTTALAKEDYGALLEHLDAVEQVGFRVEDFGSGTVLIREVPIHLNQHDAAQTIAEIAHKLARLHQDITPEFMDQLYHSVACRSAIKAHDKSHTIELEKILQLLAEQPELKHCPHGRPICAVLSKHDLEKMFGRIQ